MPDERVRELRPLRAAVRDVREEEEARDLRDLDPEVEAADRLDLRFDLPDPREPEVLRLDRAEVREELFLAERERLVPPLCFLPLRAALLRALAARDAPRCEDLPRCVRCAVSRLMSLLKLLRCPPAVVSW